MLSNRDKHTSIKDKVMSDVAYAQNMFSEAFPKSRFGSVKAMLFEAHKYVNRRTSKDFTVRRARSIWEGTARRIDAEEIDALRAALIEENIREQRELRQRLAALDASIATFHAAQAGRPVASSGAPQG